MASYKGRKYITGAVYPPRDEAYHSWHEEQGSISHDSSLESNYGNTDLDPQFIEQVKKRIKVNKKKAIVDELAELERQKNQEEYLRDKAAVAEEKQKVDELVRRLRRSREYISEEEEERHIAELVKELREKRAMEEESGTKKAKRRKGSRVTVCSIL